MTADAQEKAVVAALAAAAWMGVTASAVFHSWLLGIATTLIVPGVAVYLAFIVLGLNDDTVVPALRRWRSAAAAGIVVGGLVSSMYVPQDAALAMIVAAGALALIILLQSVLG